MKRHRYRLNLKGYQPGAVPAELAQGFPLLRPAPADSAILAELMIDAYRGTIDDDGETLEDALQEVAGFFNQASGQPLLDCSWLARSRTGLSAAILISLWQQEPLVSYVMTAAAHKGQGLAGLLLQRSLACLQQDGQQAVQAFITAGNIPSEKLFLRAGFKRIE